MALKRLQKELNALNDDSASVYNLIPQTKHNDYAFRQIHPVDGDMFLIEGLIFGRDQTPYEGAIFRVQLRIPGDYPYKPPRPSDLRVIGDLYHFNFLPHKHNQTTYFPEICDEWRPIFSLLHIFNILEDILAMKDHKGVFFEASRQNMWKQNPQEYNRLARQSALKTRDQWPDKMGNYDLILQAYNNSPVVNPGNANWQRRKSFCLFLHGCRYLSFTPMIQLPDLSQMTIGYEAHKELQVLNNLPRLPTTSEISEIVASVAFQQAITNSIAQSCETMMVVTLPHPVFDIHDICRYIASFL